jgi:ABC-type antimicrobial peptide transport system permease subunit
VKRTGRDEPIWVVIYICMLITGISLYISLYLKLAKIMSFLLSPVFSQEKKKAEQVLPRSWRGRGEGGNGEVGVRGGGGPTHVYTCK